MFTLTATILLAVLASLAADNTACATPTGRWHAELVSFRCIYGDILLPTPSLYVMRRSHIVAGQNGGFFCPTQRRSLPAVWTALLLLMAGIKPNPTTTLVEQHFTTSEPYSTSGRHLPMKWLKLSPVRWSTLD